MNFSKKIKRLALALPRSSKRLIMVFADTGAFFLIALGVSWLVASPALAASQSRVEVKLDIGERLDAARKRVLEAASHYEKQASDPTVRREAGMALLGFNKTIPSSPADLIGEA